MVNEALLNASNSIKIDELKKMYKYASDEFEGKTHLVKAKN